jgi:hypothetical protein
MPSILWVNDNGTTSVVDVDDEGNRIDLPEAPETDSEPSPEPKKRGRPRKVLLDD